VSDEEVNRKLTTTLQLLTLYIDHERHSAEWYRRTDRQTTIWWQ